MIEKLCSWLKKNKPLLITATVIILVLLIVFALAVSQWGWDWTGVTGQENKITTTPQGTNTEYPTRKTLWDWLQLLIIPAVLAIGGYLFNSTISRNEREATEKRAQTESEIALDNQRETALQGYIDKMSELLLKEHLGERTEDGKLKPGNEQVRNVARVRTLRVLPRLDNERKRNVVQFLHESGLINKDNPIISLKEADLRNASLDEAQLQKANLSGAKLMGANLSNANLEGAILYGAKYNKKRIQSRDALGNPLTLERTQWPPDIDPDDAKLGLIIEH